MDKKYEIHESTPDDLPPILRAILEENMSYLDTPWDIFSFLLHALMLETGFKSTSANFKKQTSYGFEYKLEESTENSAFCSMNIHKMGPLTTVIGNFHSDTQKYSYVFTKTNISSVVNHDKKFKDFSSISQDFKNKIALPLKYDMQDYYGIPCDNILKLPDEILVKIAEDLSDSKTIKSFTETCHRFREIASHPLLWKKLFRKRFREKYIEIVKDDENSNPNWYELFKKNVMEETEKKRKEQNDYGLAPPRLRYFEHINPPFSWIHFFDY